MPAELKEYLKEDVASVSSDEDETPGASALFNLRVVESVKEKEEAPTYRKPSFSISSVNSAGSRSSRSSRSRRSSIKDNNPVDAHLTTDSDWSVDEEEVDKAKNDVFATVATEEGATKEEVEAYLRSAGVGEEDANAMCVVEEAVEE